MTSRIDKDLFIEAIHKIPSQLTAFIACKTKPERLIFYLLAHNIEKKLEKENQDSKFVQIEVGYKIIDTYPVTVRGDLAISDLINDVDLEINSLFEGKLYYTFDTIRSNTWLNKKKYLDNDIKKLQRCVGKYNRYLVIFLIHYDTLNVPTHFAYASRHNKRIMKKLTEREDYDSGKLSDESRELIRNYLIERELLFEEKDIFILILGKYKGINIKLIVGIGEITN